MVFRVLGIWGLNSECMKFAHRKTWVGLHESCCAVLGKCQVWNFCVVKLQVKDSACVQETSLLQQVIGYLLLVMVVYFLLSIVNSTAQSYAKRLNKEQDHRKQNS